MDGDRLSDEETALVLRRAAELDHELPAPSGGLDPATLEEVAVEAGLSRQSVRQALAELRLGALEPAQPDRAAKAPARLGPAKVVVRRHLPVAAGEAEACVRDFLERQLFRVRRDVGGRSLWTPRDDLKASVQRSVDSHVQRRLVLGDVCEVHLAVIGEPGAEPPRSLVNVELDVREVRRAHGAWVATGSITGAGAVVVTAALAGLAPVTLIAVPVAAGAVMVGHRLGSALYHRRVRDLQTAVHGLLDGLERGAGRRPGGIVR